MPLRIKDKNYITIVYDLLLKMLVNVDMSALLIAVAHSPYHTHCFKKYARSRSKDQIIVSLQIVRDACLFYSCCCNQIWRSYRLFTYRSNCHIPLSPV